MLLWVCGGGVLLIVYDKDTLFYTINSTVLPLLNVIMPFITYLGEGWLIVVTLLTLLGFNRFRNWWYFTAAVLSNVLPSIFTQIIKSSVQAPRPLKYFNELQWVHTLPDWPRLMERSFPSGHTCGAFSLFCFLSLLLPERQRYYGLFFFFLALMVGYSRIYLAAHFFEDVYVGSIIGSLVSILTVSIMNKYTHLFFASKAT